MIGQREHVDQAFRFGVLLLFVGLMLAGCGVGRTMVMKPPDAKLTVHSVQATERNSPVAVPMDVKSDFANKLDQYLYEEAVFQKGPELTINYRFIQYDPGSQFTRWFWGGFGNAGEGSLTVEAKYFDSNNKELATVNVEGRIGSGLFGGALSQATDKAAEKLAEYTKTNFRQTAGKF
jgi:uncharacterized protein DUF4410